MKRRNFVNYFLGGSLAATVLAFLYPIIRFILPPSHAEAVEKRVAAAKVGELTPNSFKIFKFGASPGILVNTQDGQVVALSAVCTHLTCTVRYESDSGTLFCPCHNGRFDLAGNVISGPPPAPLETYKVEISGEEIFVSKKA
ncbi:MAG: Rieske 2Fe-2S domain-containing protein [Candidatus Aminicenantales bacterium]